MVDVIRRYCYGVDLRCRCQPGAPDAPDSTLCMAKNSKQSKDAQTSGAKGGKRGKGAPVLDLSDPADEAFDLVSNSFHTKISYLFLNPNYYRW